MLVCLEQSSHTKLQNVVKSKVIDKRDHIGGNIYCEEVEGINVHKYGAHIFHTSNKKYGTMSTNSLNLTTISTHQWHYKGSLLQSSLQHEYLLPLCGGPRLHKKSRTRLGGQTADMKDVDPKKLGKNKAIKVDWSDIYEKLIKGYTEKQWGRSATDLPPFIIKRLPVRLTFDNNYFNDRYQGIPIGGYNVIIETCLAM